MMLKTTGTLPIGIEWNGQLCREFEYREQLVRDAIEILESADVERATKSDSYYGVCLMAKRLSVEGIDKEAVTPDLIMNMTQVDFNHLAEIEQKQVAKRESFRDAAAAATNPSDSVAEIGGELQRDLDNTGG
jgi:hypothetical protein